MLSGHLRVNTVSNSCRDQKRDGWKGHSSNGTVPASWWEGRPLLIQRECWLFDWWVTSEISFWPYVFSWTSSTNCGVQYSLKVEGWHSHYSRNICVVTCLLQQLCTTCIAYTPDNLQGCLKNDWKVIKDEAETITTEDCGTSPGIVHKYFEESLRQEVTQLRSEHTATRAGPCRIAACTKETTWMVTSSEPHYTFVGSGKLCWHKFGNFRHA